MFFSSYFHRVSGRWHVYLLFIRWEPLIHQYVYVADITLQYIWGSICSEITQNKSRIPTPTPQKVPDPALRFDCNILSIALDHIRMNTVSSQCTVTTLLVSQTMPQVRSTNSD